MSYIGPYEPLSLRAMVHHPHRKVLTICTKTVSRVCPTLHSIARPSNAMNLYRIHTQNSGRGKRKLGKSFNHSGSSDHGIIQYEIGRSEEEADILTKVLDGIRWHARLVCTALKR